MTKLTRKSYYIKAQDKSIERDVPDFDWEEFKKLPNAEMFARKCYFANVQRIVSEVADGHRNQTTETHLVSMESVLVRSLFFTKQQVEEWVKSRNWSLWSFKSPVEGSEEVKRHIVDKLAGQKESRLPAKVRARLQECIATVADKPSDDIADYLFYKLDLQSEQVQLADL